MDREYSFTFSGSCMKAILNDIVSFVYDAIVMSSLTLFLSTLKAYWLNLMYLLCITEYFYICRCYCCI